MATEQQIKEIGETLWFTTEYSPNGIRNLIGTVVGRDWCHERLAYYTVKTLTGNHYNVNAETMEGGRPF